MYNKKYKNISITSTLLNINDVLKRTYMLLSGTILFSALTCLISIKLDIKPINIILMLILNIGLLILIHTLKNNTIRLSLVFSFTGLNGCYIAPIINSIANTHNGTEIIMLSLTLTGVMFFTLSVYALTTKKNLTNLQGFLTIGLITIIATFIIYLITNMQVFNLIFSGAIIIFSSCYILYTINEIINNNDIDYISATINLYLDIYNIFINLLSILRHVISKD